MGRFHTYSFGNILEIARQKPEATRIAGLYAWNKLGRKVSKGQKGTNEELDECKLPSHSETENSLSAGSSQHDSEFVSAGAAAWSTAPPSYDAPSLDGQDKARS